MALSVVLYLALILLLVGLAGHAVLWAAVFNRIHSTGISPRFPLAFTITPFLLFLAILAGYGWWFSTAGLDLFDPRGFPLPRPLAAYLVLCWLAALWALLVWVGRRVSRGPPGILRHHRTRLVDLAGIARRPRRESDRGHLLLRLPGNQTLSLDVAERSVDVPGLDPALDRLTIAHLSDLHFSGKVPREYFDEVVRLANQWEPDLVALTGDLVNKNRVLDWAPAVLSRLRAGSGVYFILGNHDATIDHRRLRRMLVDAGLVNLGGRSLEVSLRGLPVILAGNELPWFPPAPLLGNGAAGGPLRILLAHTPDQLAWAQSHRIDLMLAGHLHGGQIRLPVVGPILSPSRLGLKYSSGLFHAPPTILHVTRGVSGDPPIRLNCPPEIVRLVLRAAASPGPPPEPGVRHGARPARRR